MSREEAVLHGKSGEHVFGLRPGLNLKGQFEIRFSASEKRLIHTTVPLWPEDVAGLALGLTKVVDGKDYFEMESFDISFVLTADSRRFAPDVAVGFWLGEPYQLMNGYRFVATDREVKSFVATVTGWSAETPE